MYMELILETINEQIDGIKIKQNDITNLNCPDQVVAKLSYDNNKFVYEKNWINKDMREKNKCYTIIKKNKNLNRIVIILESPHKDEYEGEFIAPALGFTGISLSKNFLENFNNIIQEHILHIENGEYELILMNAIQYQTSLGKDTTVFRDRVWLSMWMNKKEDFKQRLIKYKPNIIFNLCTKGNHLNDPIYIANKACELSHIRYDYIQKLGTGVSRNKDNGELKIGDKVIYYKEYITGKKLDCMNYFLNGFVQSEIDNCNLEKRLKFLGVHPSSKWFKKLNEHIKIV